MGIGYSMAGVNVKTTNSEEEAYKILRQEINNTNNGLIAIKEEFYNYIFTKDERFTKQLKQLTTPLIISIPSMREIELGKGAIQKYTQRVIERAAGFYIKVDLEL